MMKERAGYTKKNLTGELAYFSYVPSPLPPSPPIELKGNLLSAFIESKAHLRVLDNLSSHVADKNLLIYMYVRKEALLSSQIEGTQATLEDIFSTNDAEGVSLDVLEVSNYVEALDYALGRLSSLPLSNRLLKETHAILLQSGRGSEKSPGEFRRSQNWIGESGSSLKNAAYIPPSPEDMERSMNDLEKFMNEEDGIDPLIKIGLIHYQFETIHPFLDGNGRIGRMLIPLYLVEKKEISSPILTISYFLKESRYEYYDRMSEVRQNGDYEQWLLFFLKCLSSCALSTIESIEKTEKLLLLDKEKILLKGKSRNLLPLFLYLFKHPIIDIPQASKDLSLSFNTVAKGVNSLMEMGILKQRKSQKRNRSFIYQDYLDILKGA